ncbi:MAG: right-handed parallel beta-helix repeat-containing protein [Armatimonadota bacterium]
MIFAVVSSGVAEARDYYVSPSGNDSNPGTHARPWQTIARVSAMDFRPGDRVLFEGGKTFPGTIRLDGADSGARGRPVELTSYGEGRATIDAGNGGGLVASGCSYLAISNLNFVGSGRKAGNTEAGLLLAGGEEAVVDGVEVSGFRSSGLALAGMRDSRVAIVYAHDNGADGISVGSSDAEEQRWSERVYIGHCVAENNPGDPSNLDNHSGNGIVVGCVRDCVIEYCEAMNNGWDMPREGNGPVGIWAWKADRVIIQFCVSHDNKSPGWDGGGFDFDGGVTNSILQYNYSYNNVGPGYFLCQYPTAPAWKNNIVRYNISVNDGYRTNVGAGIEVIANGTGMSDAEVYNNTVYNDRGAAVGFGGIPVPGVRFRNNVFVTRGPLIKGDFSPARFEGNCYWQLDPNAVFAAAAKEEAGGSAHSADHRAFADWVAATGQEKAGAEIVGIFADPKLAEMGAMPALKPDQLPALAPYRLLPGSPCLDAGLTIGDNGGRDFWGSPLPATGRPSIGACQSAPKAGD